MNLRQLQYVMELAKTRNFSHASENLKISQPALSKQILNLESELGVKLFDRNTVPFTMTPAGEHFVRQAQTLLQQEDQLLRSMEQFKSGERGQLDIGVSPFRNFYLMPQFIKLFKEKYPRIQVVLHESPSDQLRQDAANGKFDFAIVNHPINDTALEARLLRQETLVLAVPNALVSRIRGTDEAEPGSIDFSQCQDLPFVVVSQTQEMRRYFDRLCTGCGFTPEIAIEVAGGVITAWAMARAGLGATLLPLQFVKQSAMDEQLTLFTLRNTAYTRQPLIVTRRGQYLPEHVRYAIDLLMTL